MSQGGGSAGVGVLNRLQAAIDELYAKVARAGGAATTARSTFVFQPGGVASGNVFTSWTALYAALNVAAPTSANGTRPPTVISVDDTFVEPASHATVPAGAYNLDGVTFTCVADHAAGTAGFGAVLDFAVGVTLVVPTQGLTLRFQGGGTFQYLDATPCITVAAGQSVILNVSEKTNLQTAGAGAFISVPAGQLNLEVNNSTIGDGVHAVVSAVGPGTAGVRAYANSSLAANATTGNGVTAFWDSKVPGAQGAGVTISQADGYVPAVGGNWHPAPTTQSGALDQIAAAAARPRSGHPGFRRRGACHHHREPRSHHGDGTHAVLRLVLGVERGGRRRYRLPAQPGRRADRARHGRE